MCTVIKSRVYISYIPQMSEDETIDEKLRCVRAFAKVWLIPVIVLEYLYHIQLVGVLGKGLRGYLPKLLATLKVESV